MNRRQWAGRIYVAALLACAMWLVNAWLPAAVLAASGQQDDASPVAATTPVEQQAVNDQQNPLNLDADGIVLLDTRSGQVLYSYHRDQRVPPASLAKLMTFVLSLDAIKAGKLSTDQKVTVTKEAWKKSMTPGISKMFLRVNSQVTVDQLLYGLMVASGNDAAVELADVVGGSTGGFVQMMNQQAQKLGLKDTQYQNPDGLPADNQYTTAWDMAKLGKYVLDNYPDDLKYTEEHYFSYQPPGAPKPIKQENWNILVLRDNRVTGLKTGHTEKAGYHLVATATGSDGMTLVSSLLGSCHGCGVKKGASTRANLTEQLLNWGFHQFQDVNLKGKLPSRQLTVYKGKKNQLTVVPDQHLNTWVTVARGSASKLNYKVQVPGRVMAPVKAGQPIGSIEVTLGNQTIKTIPLVAKNAVARGSLFKRAWDTFLLWLHGAMKSIHL